MGLRKVRQKGQITIPKDVREALGIQEGDYVVFVVDGKTAILSPVRKRKLSELKGTLPPTRPFPGVEQVRREVGRELGRQRDREISKGD